MEIDTSYVTTITRAAKIHAGAAELSNRLRTVLVCLADHAIEQPRDWEFHYSGPIELRWWKTDSYAASPTVITLWIENEKLSVRAWLSRKYGDSEGQINTGWLPDEAGFTMIVALLRAFGYASTTPASQQQP